MDMVVETADRLTWRNASFRCAIGRGGFSHDKIEGDGTTPVGAHPLRRVFYRPDRMTLPVTCLPLQAIDPADGWCDDPDEPAYNQLVLRPFDGRHEEMWRDDALYDLVVELGYNDAPVIQGKGSAVFLHVARDDYGPTEGCVALAQADLLRVLAECDPSTRLIVSPR